MNSFTELEAWKVSHKLVLQVYLLSKRFPKDEVYGLTSQMRRSAVSVTSNLAEGFGRRSYADKGRFYNMAYGSLSELHSQLFIARDLDYLSEIEIFSLEELLVQAKKLTNGLITSTNSHSS